MGVSMKRILWVIILAFALIIPNIVQAKEGEESIISVNATATETVSPDIANVTFSVTTEAKTAQKAAEQNRINSQTLYNYLNSVISKKDGDSIKTTSFNVIIIQRRSCIESKFRTCKNSDIC